jgi:hypothetical protein
MIGKLLGHAEVQTTARYAHLLADPIIAAATKIAETLAAAMVRSSPTPSPSQEPVSSDLSHMRDAARSWRGGKDLQRAEGFDARAPLVTPQSNQKRVDSKVTHQRETRMCQRAALGNSPT